MSSIHSSEERILFLFYTFNTTLQKNPSRETIQKNINIMLSEISKLHTTKRLYYVSNLIILAIQKRAIRLTYGEGKRLISYWMLIHLYQYFPRTIFIILRELPYIGYWGDLNNIYKIVYDDNKILKPGEYDTKIKNNQNLLDNIVDVWCIQMDKDKRFINKLYPTEFESVSFMSKWAPRERGSFHKHTKVINHILQKYDPQLWYKNRNEAKKNYRKFISKCNEKLCTTEILMCSKSFSQIDFSFIPKKCMDKYHSAWLDVNENGKRRHPNNTDRNIARNNYLDYMNNHEDDDDTLNKKLPILDILDSKFYSIYKHVIVNSKETTEYFNKTNINPYYNGDYLNNYISDSDK